MKCRVCGSTNTKVINSRTRPQGKKRDTVLWDYVKRQRICCMCGTKFNTKERYVHDEAVRGNNGDNGGI